MADNGITKIYQFLSSFGTQDGQAGWVEKADCKKQDGIITKAEFRAFINDNWNGEESLSDDLINQFWAKVDTNKSSKITGAKLSNKNALDKKEQDAMLRSIKAYEAAEKALENISTTAAVGDSSEWKNSIREGLINKIEKDFLKSNRPIEEIDDYIEEVLPGIQRKATADYCAQAYIGSTMSDAVQKYEYKYGDDSTLKSIIDNYVKSIENEEIEDSEIEETVKDIVDAYKATAEPDGAPDLELLAQYGYKVSDGSALNDLQKAIAKGTMKEALKAVEQETDYTDFKEIYDNAVTKFIDGKLSSAKFANFSDLLAVDYSQFTASKEFKNAKNSITVQKFLTSTELAAAITEKYGERVANSVIKDGAYIAAIKDLKTTVLEKVEKGEFLNGDEIDTDKVQTFVLNEIGKHLADLYKGDLNKMSLDELSSMYDNLYASAMEDTNAENQLKGIINAAKKYCEALSKKSTTLAEAITEILGGNYASVLNDMLPSEIDDKIKEIKAKATVIGDPADFKGKLPADAWGDLTDKIDTSKGVNKNYKLANSFTINNVTITTNRITYSVTGNALQVDNAGNVKVNTKTEGTYTSKINILVDGVVIGTKEVTVNVGAVTSAASVIDNVTNANTVISNTDFVYNTGGNSNYKLQSGYHNAQTFSDLYNNDGYFTVFGREDDDDWNVTGQSDADATTMGNAVAAVKEGLVNVGKKIIDVLKTAGLNEATLTQALENVATRYASTIMENASDSGINWDDKNDKNDNGIISNHWDCGNGDNNTKLYEYMKQTRDDNGHKVVHAFDTGGSNDSNVYAIYFKDFVDDLVKEYYALGGN